MFILKINTSVRGKVIRIACALRENGSNRDG